MDADKYFGTKQSGIGRGGGSFGFVPEVTVVMARGVVRVRVRDLVLDLRATPLNAAV